MSDLTEDQFYGHIVAQLEEDDNPLVDHIASVADWSRCKRALERWIAERDAEWDRQARADEHGTER